MNGSGVGSRAARSGRECAARGRGPGREVVEVVILLARVVLLGIRQPSAQIGADTAKKRSREREASERLKKSISGIS